MFSFLNVLPPQLRSAPVTEASSYYQYVSESQRQYTIVLTACKSFTWPNEAISDDNLSSDSQPEADSRQFYEGPFLKMIFARIRDLPNQVNGDLKRLSIYLFFLSFYSVTIKKVSLYWKASTVLSQAKKLILFPMPKQ